MSALRQRRGSPPQDYFEIKQVLFIDCYNTLYRLVWLLVGGGALRRRRQRRSLPSIRTNLRSNKFDLLIALTHYPGWFGSWWEGEHVCVETEETEEGVASYRDFHFTFKINGMDMTDDGDFMSSSNSYVHEVRSLRAIFMLYSYILRLRLFHCSCTGGRCLTYARIKKNYGYHSATGEKHY
jgi:hypothetical protein